MDDITNQLNKILSDPNSMAQIENIMNSLGLNNNQNNNQNNSQPSPQPQVQQPNPPQQTQNNFNNAPIPNADMLNMLTGLAPILTQMKTEDNSTRLLTALRPMISAERGAKVDQALKILQIMKVFPMLKDSGILSNILGGLF